MEELDIIKNIVNQNLCTGCGMCISESESSLVMDWDEYGFLVPKRKNTSSTSKLNPLRVCPFNPSPEEAIADEDKLSAFYLKDANYYDEKIGHFENTYIGYSYDYRKTSSSGGIATYIFKRLLEERIVDHLFIVKEVNGTYQYQLFSDINEITAISKTRYIPVTMEELFTKIDNLNGKVAISGVACFIKAIRLKQYYYPELKEKIPFLIGIICGGLKSVFFTDYLAQKTGIKETYSNQEYRIKNEKNYSSDYSFGAYNDKNEFRTIRMREVGDMWGTGLFKSNACDFCTDVLTELADISLGDAWLEEYLSEGLGNSIIVTRTKLADSLITIGIANQELHAAAVPKELIVKSQRGSFNHRQDALKFRVLIRRMQRTTVPHLRHRVFRSISFPFKIVQLQRLVTRKMSLKIWREKSNANSFEKAMKPYLKTLSVLTRIYHKLK